MNVYWYLNNIFKSIVCTRCSMLQLHIIEILDIRCIAQGVTWLCYDDLNERKDLYINKYCTVSSNML